MTTPPFCIFAKPRLRSSVPNRSRFRSSSRGTGGLRAEHPSVGTSTLRARSRQSHAAGSRIQGSGCPSSACSPSEKRLSEPVESAAAVRVVCVTGMPGCGKEEVLAVAQALGFSIVRMGDVVREEALRRGLPISDAAVGGMAHAERQVHGLGIWAERTLPRISGDRVLVDGLRGRAELEIFRNSFGDDLSVVAVHASPRTRYERMLRRRRTDDAGSIEAFGARDLRELSWGLGDVIATADVMLVNEGTLEEFRRAARTALGRLHG
ncbi:MAG: flagellar hook-basal body complex protein FliE [Methanobacteriota archaeon]|nr:MAG: flagellar hook-basal body complex protein FliE [Euryarchaeota archaeon]TMA07447.1 MAG: flagellar hook-basal body complex protein FliE [Euryarchaeota archaeon]